MVENVSGWVWDGNVHQLMRHLSHAVAYEFDDLDWHAVEAGLAPTDAQQGRFFDYPLVGEKLLDVSLAREPDAHPVVVRVSGDLNPVLAARIETLIALLSDPASNR